MIEIIPEGDLFRSNAEAFVNTVNCVGVSGKGIALEFKQRYPTNYALYHQACVEGRVTPGRMFVTETGMSQPRFIVNFPTKRHWRNRSFFGDILVGLRGLVWEIQQREIKSIAIPALGCNNGGLNWKVVRPAIERAMRPLHDVLVLIYEPL